MSFSGQTWTIAADGHEATIVEVGAGLRRYAPDGTNVTCAYGDDELPPKGCGITLAPWPNRIRDGRYTFDGTSQQLALSDPDNGNAIHGLGRWVRWALVEQAPDAVTLRLDVVPQKGYPFEVRVDVTYAVGTDGLTVTTAARNTGTTRAPFGTGAHPYLSARGHRLDDCQLLLPAESALDLDTQKIPTGTRPVTEDEDYRTARPLGAARFDAAYTGLVGTTAELHTPTGGARLWFDDTYRFLQAYTVDELTPGCSGVAVEPMTCAPDAFNSGDGLIVLEPGASWSGRWGVAPF